MLKKILLSIFATFFFFSFTLGTALAETGPIEPVGPQQPTGVQQETGPIGTTGNILPTGPIGPTGIQEPTGPQTITTSENSQTGTNSENTNNITNSSETNLSEQNNANINNQVDENLNTGNNLIAQNSIVNSLTTGGIDGSTTIVNQTNTNLADGSSIGTQNINPLGQTNITLDPSIQRTELGNNLTGSNSENTNNVNNLDTINLTGVNDANLNNLIDIMANTGVNQISNNTKVGEIATGDINLGVNLINLANLNLPNMILSADVWNILGNYSGDFILKDANSFTGPYSENENSINQNETNNIDITQNADLSNYFNINTNTGENEIGSNTALGDIETGSTRIKTALTNITNALSLPVFYIFNVFGSWDGNLLGLNPNQVLINEMTGLNSENENNVTNTEETNVTLENNTTVDNRININANTGRNTISNNTMVGSIKTGAINITANVVNVLNSFSEQAGNFALRIVNIFGNWKGSAKSEDYVNNEKPINEGQKETIAIKEKQEIKSETTISTQEETIKTQEPTNEDIEEFATSKEPDSIISSSLNQEVESNIETETLAETGAEKGLKDISKEKSNQLPQPFSYLFFGLLGIIAIWLVTEVVALNKNR